MEYLIGFIFGVIIAGILFSFVFIFLNSGEIQLYHEGNEIYPVLSLKSRKVFKKKIAVFSIVDHSQK